MHETTPQLQQSIGFAPAATPGVEPPVDVSDASYRDAAGPSADGALEGCVRWSEGRGAFVHDHAVRQGAEDTAEVSALRLTTEQALLLRLLRAGCGDVEIANRIQIPPSDLARRWSDLRRVLEGGPVPIGRAVESLHP